MLSSIYPFHNFLCRSYLALHNHIFIFCFYCLGGYSKKTIYPDQCLEALHQCIFQQFHSLGYFKLLIHSKLIFVYVIRKDFSSLLYQDTSFASPFKNIFLCYLNIDVFVKNVTHRYLNLFLGLLCSTVHSCIYFYVKTRDFD